MIKYELEADFVFHLNDIRYVLIEIKLGSKKNELGLKHLDGMIREHNKNERCANLGYIV